MTTAPSSRPDPLRSPLARLAELALVVPIEVSGRVIDAVPVVVDKVPPAADRVRRELVLARFLGKLAVDQGLRELRSRLLPADAAADDCRRNRRPPEDAEVVVATGSVRRWGIDAGRGVTDP